MFNISLAICGPNGKRRLKLIASLDVSFHIFLLCMIMPLVGSGGVEGTWISNYANLLHAGTEQMCPSAFTMLEVKSDGEFALEIHDKKENWSLSVFVLFCCCGNNIECFLETTDQLLCSSWQSFLSLFDTLLSLSTCYISTVHLRRQFLSAYL